ncbi:uncharacterized protein CLUP02_12688 [Colletotrichum lupini]|uniref:DUF6546 domain-containing protein n=1 Tax=Colletotrichum lupini TaxID=145971 RepID=A0A9Q8WL22_9PEZI|nr:uncharacterized protein CLUP02_12688 [Colletotrichum lupini]UQC87186.1 hypothetical protein CLUP02_12688 [Colletotrichum lupini]
MAMSPMNYIDWDSRHISSIHISKDISGYHTGSLAMKALPRPGMPHRLAAATVRTRNITNFFSSSNSVPNTASHSLTGPYPKMEGKHERREAMSGVFTARVASSDLKACRNAHGSPITPSRGIAGYASVSKDWQDYFERSTCKAPGGAAMSGTSGFALRSLSPKRMARLYRGINHGAHLLQLRCIYGILWRHGKYNNNTPKDDVDHYSSILRPGLLRRMMRPNPSVTRAYSGLPTWVKVKVSRCIPELPRPFSRTMSSLAVYGYRSCKSLPSFFCGGQINATSDRILWIKSSRVFLAQWKFILRGGGFAADMCRHGLPPSLKKFAILHGGSSTPYFARVFYRGVEVEELVSSMVQGCLLVEHLALCFIIDADDFLNNAPNLPKPKTLTLNADMFLGESGDIDEAIERRTKIKTLLFSLAALAACWMPKLELMEIWNGRDRQVSIPLQAWEATARMHARDDLRKSVIRLPDGPYTYYGSVVPHLDSKEHFLHEHNRH